GRRRSSDRHGQAWRARTVGNETGRRVDLRAGRSKLRSTWDAARGPAHWCSRDRGAVVRNERVHIGKRWLLWSPGVGHAPPGGSLLWRVISGTEIHEDSGGR